MPTPISIVHNFDGRVEFVATAGVVTAFLAYTSLDIRDATGELLIGGAQGPLPLDLWPQMTAGQKASIQGIYTAIVAATLPTVTSIS